MGFIATKCILLCNKLHEEGTTMKGCFMCDLHLPDVVYKNGAVVPDPMLDKVLELAIRIKQAAIKLALTSILATPETMHLSTKLIK